MNAKHYKGIKNRETQREMTRIRAANYRERKKRHANRDDERDAALPSVTSVSVSVFNKEGKESVREKETSFKDSVFFEFAVFRERLKDWSEEKARHYHNLFLLQEKYKYKDWSLAARRWDQKEPWIPPASSEQAAKTIEEMFAQANEVHKRHGNP